jgi:hypothetical protein
MDIILSRKIYHFVKTIYENKKVTGRDFKGMNRSQFWLMSRYLRDNGIITVNGVNDRNERMWILTVKGKKFAESARQMVGIIDGEQEIDN